ncbi:MAG: DNA polymerase I [Phycisphaerales bacterium]|nr:DNA polymerase I [Phycisphaerales bacterium]
MARSVYLLDGHYQIYRAYFAPFAPLTSPSGEPTKAVHVFCATLFNLIRNRRPDYLAMVMDTSDETVFRRDIDPNYKANRDPPPDDFGPQRDRIVSIVQAMNVPILRVPRFEADDIMATIARRLANEPVDVYLVSVDKDLEQLITDRVRMYDVAKDLVVDAAGVLERKGYTPSQAVEIQSLVGDNVDNIPGIHGVGIKTAAKLIAQYGTARAVIEHAGELTPKMQERVRAFADQLIVTRQLVTLRDDVPVDIELDAMRFNGVPVDRLRPIFNELGFNRLRDQLESFGASEVSPAGNRPGSPAPTAVKTASANRRPKPTAGLFDDEPDTTDPAVPAPGPSPSSRPAPDTSDNDYQLIDTPDKLKSLATQLAKQKRFAFDTETTGLNAMADALVGISVSWAPHTGSYIPIRAAMGDTLPLESVVKLLKPIFENPAIRKTGHNVKFDMLVLRQHGIDVRGVFFDPMIAAFLVEPLRSSHGLKALARDVTGAEMTTIQELIGRGKQQITIDQLDTAVVGAYAAADADQTLRLTDHFEPLIRGSPYESLFHETEIPLVDVLVQMESNGVAIDADALAKMGSAMADRMIALTKDIHREAGHPFNVDSTKQLATVLFDEIGLKVVRRTKTGRSTDAESLTELAETTENPVPRLVLEYRELSKLKGTYVDTLPTMVNPRTGRIHASFHQTGAVTGRLSSSDPNLQNIPIRTQAGREIRRAFVPGKRDHVLLSADYSQIELRVLAHFSRDDALLRAFDQNQDIHAFVAAQVNGVPIDEVTREKRSAAKAVNFGIIYGQTAFGLARGLGISRTQAESFIDMYFMRYPGIRLFIDQCIADARRNGFVQTILGRRRPLPELQSRNRQQIAFGERIAVNTVIQGSAADLIKRAMIDIHAALSTGKHPSQMLIQVHDELVFETPAGAVESESEMIRDKMTRAIPLDVPIAVDIAWGKNWLETK